MFIQPIIHTQAACNYLMLKYKHEYNNQSTTGMGGVSEIMSPKLAVTLLLQPTCPSCVAVTAVCIHLLLKLKVHLRSTLIKILFMISVFKQTEFA
jgi:hypothetical protein